MFDRNLKPFLVHQSEIRICVNYLKANRTVKKSVYNVIDRQAHHKYDLDIVEEYFKTALPERVLLNSLFLSVAASYEDFLRGVLKNTILIIDRNTNQFDDLEEKLRNRHMKSTGSMIASHASSPSYLNVNYKKISENIAKCFPGSSNFSLNLEIVEFVKGILNLQNFFDFLLLCGFSISYDDLAKTEKVKAHFKKTNTRERANEIKVTHVKILALRNRVAHTGQSTSDLTIQVLEDYLSQIEAVSIGICEFLYSKIKSKYNLKP